MQICLGVLMVCARKKVASLLGATVYIQPVTSAMMRHAIHSPISIYTCVSGVWTQHCDLLSNKLS